MLDYLGVTENWTAIENIPWTQRWKFSDDATREPVSLDGVTFTGRVNLDGQAAPVELNIEKSAALAEAHILIISCIGLPEGRHPYEIYSISESGNQNRLISGYIGVIKSIGKLVDDSKTYASRTLSIRLPGDATRQIRLEWNSCTIASISAEHALNAARQTHADAETTSKAATTATGAATSATARAMEAEGYAGAAYTSKEAAGNSATAANTSAVNTARDAKTASDVKTAVEGIVSTFTQTASDAEQTISSAKDTAVTAVQTKQNDAVLAVGRSSQTAQNNISSAKGAALESVSTAQKGAVLAVTNAQTAATGAITPLVQRAETAQAEVEMAEGRVMILETNAAQSSTDASEAATSAQQALAAVPPVDAAGNMGLTGKLTANGATVNGQLNANGGINIPVPPATDTDGVNRLYAAGLSAVMDAARIPLYLSKAKSTLTQGAFTEPAPGLVLSAPVAAKSRQMLSIGLDYTMHAASNYSQGLGWVLPLRSTVYGQLKVSVSYGHGVYTAASSDDMDAYEIYPTDASKQAYGAAMDIYLNQTNIGGNLAAVRTRIIYYDLAVKMMMVRTVTAHVEIHNTGLISATTAIVYQQHSDTHGAARPSDYGSIWLIRNGMAPKNIVKIADVPGIHSYGGARLNSPVLINGKVDGVDQNWINVGAPVMQLSCGNGRNPAYYGFQAVETNAIISTTTAPYEPPTNV